MIFCYEGLLRGETKTPLPIHGWHPEPNWLLAVRPSVGLTRPGITV